MAQVQIGTVSFKNIQFVAFDIPQVTRFDVVLGRSLLQHTKVELDYSLSHLSMEERQTSDDKKK